MGSHRGKRTKTWVLPLVAFLILLCVIGITSYYFLDFLWTPFLTEVSSD